MINKALKCSDEVYVFRAHNHLENKTELIEWCMFNCKNTVPKLKIFFKEYKRELEVMSSDKSDIYIIDLKANENRESFSSRFKIDYSSFRHNFSKKALENEMLVDNPEYDQYDFIFVKDNNIYMWTSMHELLIFINEGENE
jgi:arginyl-tRNA synthetase